MLSKNDTIHFSNSMIITLAGTRTLHLLLNKQFNNCRWNIFSHQLPKQTKVKKNFDNLIKNDISNVKVKDSNWNFSIKKIKINK